jgi:SAM-dependent MidA family methyltransferase
MTRGGPGSTSALPAPGPDAEAHGRRVGAALHARLEAAGDWLPFADYMRCALYEPGLGYYSAGAAKFGPAGDFVTAPEISGLFAEVFAGQFAAVLAGLGGGSVLELGPGTGRFAATALAAWPAHGPLPDEYLLLEVSGDLRERQQRQVAVAAGAAAPRARWLEALPPRFAGVVFANEVLDALPCERFVLRAGEPWRLGVGACGAGFAWSERRPDGSHAGDQAFVEATRELPLAGLPDGYRGEFHPGLAAWIRALADGLQRGVVMLVDYGLPRSHYYHPQREAGTLRCHYRHLAHDDPFSYPGLTDITAWVDFTAVAEAAVAAGLDVAGFTTQAAFLLGAGIDARFAAAHEAAASEAARVRLAHGARQLLLPGEMGEAIKVMVLARDCEVPLPGLLIQDLRDSL